MALRSGQRCLQVEYLGDVTIVKFRRREILDMGMIEDIGEELFKLVQQERRHHLLVNLGNIDRISTAMVGKFLAAHQRAQAATGQLSFCSLDPRIHEVFELLKLTDVFRIFENEQQGLEALATARG
jgi:stage II sporulation protein AA (anti-sigma F factor antagonist)